MVSSGPGRIIEQSLRALQRHGRACALCALLSVSCTGLPINSDGGTDGDRVPRLADFVIVDDVTILLAARDVRSHGDKVLLMSDDRGQSWSESGEWGFTAEMACLECYIATHQDNSNEKRRRMQIEGIWHTDCNWVRECSNDICNR